MRRPQFIKGFDMANITIKFSQAVIDQQNTGRLSNPQLNGSIGSLFDAIMSANYAVDKAYAYYSSWSFSGTTLRMNFADGATMTYTGVVLANPDATSGAASATGFEFYANGFLSASETGKFNLNYAITPAGAGFDLSLTESNFANTITAFRIATLLPTNSSAYDKTVGNVSILVSGVVTSQGENFSGNVSKIVTTADKFILSGAIEGNFQISGNELTAGQGLTYTSATGTLTGYQELYRDGSSAQVSNLSTYLDANQVLDETMFANPARFSGSDTISLDLPATLYRDFLMASGDGNDVISVKGGGGRLNVQAGNGNDKITILGDAHSIDGGAGLDYLALSGARAGYKVLKAAGGYTVTDGGGKVSTVSNVERISFGDATLALDIDGNGGQTYRLYQAAFNRAPDAGGLGYWIGEMDKGATLSSIASGFVTSNEFKLAYGAAPSNKALVTQFYQNILHRAPEAAGLDYWVGILDANGSKAGVLAAISESAENQAGVIGIIGNGFTYTPYGG
jgi:hypothetical protein